MLMMYLIRIPNTQNRKTQGSPNNPPDLGTDTYRQSNLTVTPWGQLSLTISMFSL